MCSKNVDGIILELKRHAKPSNREGMARFGIKTDFALGVPIPRVRNAAKKIGKNHFLALELWGSKIHEARILACIVDEPKAVTEKQLEEWVKEFNSWDLCDQCCLNLFDRTPFAYRKAVEWSARKEEFVKRAGFALMAVLAVHDKKAADEEFLKFLPIIKREAGDKRNFVKKAVNWALRQIGKRNAVLNKAAIETAVEIKRLDSSAAKWIAGDALRELQSGAVKKKFKK